MPNPKYQVLTANVVATVELDADYSFARLDIVVAGGASQPVYFTVDESTPDLAADGSTFLHGVLGSWTEVDVPTSGTVTVKLKSAGTPTVSVRGVR